MTDQGLDTLPMQVTLFGWFIQWPKAQWDPRQATGHMQVPACVTEGPLADGVQARTHFTQEIQGQDAVVCGFDGHEFEGVLHSKE